MACLMQETNLGTIFIMKLPGVEIDSLRGRIQIGVRHELYDHPQAPVIRTLFRFYDKPASPLAIETFTNVADEQQRRDFADLERQQLLTMTFFDERLVNRLNKKVGHPDRQHIPRIVNMAMEVLGKIPAERLDFDRAKADVVRQASL